MKSTNILKIELSNRRRKRRRRRRIQNERERRNDEIMDKYMDKYMGEEERIDRRQAKHLKRKKNTIKKINKCTKKQQSKVIH